MSDKKNPKKPEMTIYRPGMGLPVKKENKDKNPSKSSLTNDGTIGTVNSEHNENKNSSNNNNQEQSKTTKVRRPHRQVYFPRPNKPVQLNADDSKSAQLPPDKDKSCIRSTRKKSLNAEVESRDTEKDSLKVVSKSSQMNSENPCAHIDLNYVNESGVSTSTSSKKKLHESNLCDTVNYSSVKEDRSINFEGEQGFNSADSKTYISSQNLESDNRFLSSCVINCDIPSDLNSNVMSFAQLPSEKNISLTAKPIPVDSVAQSDRQKNIVNLPPGFPKNKNQQLENQLNIMSPQYNCTLNSDSGDILKFPVSFNGILNSTQPGKTEIYIPEMYQEKSFTHKSLFDSNNLNNSEITLHHSKFHNYDYSDSSSYMTHSLNNACYIPPPKPAAFYEICDMNANCASKSFSNKTKIATASLPPAFHPTPISPPITSTSFSLKSAPPTSVSPAPVLPTPPFTSPSVPPVLFSVAVPPVSPAPVPQVCSRYSILYPEKLQLSEAEIESDKTFVKKKLNELINREKELYSLLRKEFDEQNEHDIVYISIKLHYNYLDIILTDPQYAVDKNLMYWLWKTVFAQIIDLYKKDLDENPKADENIIKEKIMAHVRYVDFFFSSLIRQLENRYNFEMKKILKHGNVITKMDTVPEHFRMLLIIVQKIYIYLGALECYKEKFGNISRYTNAKSYYQQALQIMPDDGATYYRLAILSISANNKLDTVYYYIRSIAVNNPVLLAEEDLLTFLEEVIRKSDMDEEVRTQETRNKNESLEMPIEKRTEVWIKSNGWATERPCKSLNSSDAKILMSTTGSSYIESLDVRNLSDKELDMRFTTHFLFVHGRLLTNAGLESCPGIVKQMLKEFYFLLQRKPLPISSFCLLQLLAINIFSVYNSAIENLPQHGGFSSIQKQALHISMAMMSILMDRCLILYITHKSSPDFAKQKVGKDLAELLPSVKIWTDWMCCQKAVGVPPSSHILKELQVSFVKDIWTLFADLLTVLKEIDMQPPVLSAVKESDCDFFSLEEDNEFTGFLPLVEAMQEPVYIRRPYERDIAKIAWRINKIQLFGDYLCGISPPCMQFDVERKKFSSLMDEIFPGISNAYEVGLEKHKSEREIILQIKPKFLIPDARSFLEHFCLFGDILKMPHIHLIVPLVVIEELSVLAHCFGITQPEPEEEICRKSRFALMFLEHKISQENSRVKVITPNGFILNNIKFNHKNMAKNMEDVGEGIITSCLYYCKESKAVPQNPDEQIIISRDVVLLTDNYNLQRKAQYHDIPVIDVPSFLQWEEK